jgi:hypothetical protein
MAGCRPTDGEIVMSLLNRWITVPISPGAKVGCVMPLACPRRGVVKPSKMAAQTDGREHDEREVEDMERGEKCALSPGEVPKCLKDSPRFLDKSPKPRTQEIVRRCKARGLIHGA